MDHDKVHVMNCSHPSGHEKTALAALDKCCVVNLQGAFPHAHAPRYVRRAWVSMGKIPTMGALLKLEHQEPEAMTRQYHACENFQAVPEKDVAVILGSALWHP
jgi:hypothetical protein